MRHPQLVMALLFCAAIGLSRAASAQDAARPTILNVTMDAAGDQLTITGSGFGPTPVVTIDGQSVPVLAGATDTQVTVVTPAVLLTTPGSYRLTVADPVRQVGDTFVVVSRVAVESAVNVASSGTQVGSGNAASQSRTAAEAASATSSPAVPSVARGGPVARSPIEDSGSPYTTALGYQAAVNTTGSYNTALGGWALGTNNTGHDNTATGFGALFLNSTGTFNTANGSQALLFNTIGNYNTATGPFALWSNTIGSYNTASGFGALVLNIQGSGNTASGYEALYSNSTVGIPFSVNTVSGDNNTASGYQALYSNREGTGNTASGYQALYSNSSVGGHFGPTSGDNNTASGYSALYSNYLGSGNTASGDNALYSNINGSNNTALGSFAGYSATAGRYNLFLGAEVIGTASDTNTIRLGLPYDGTNGQNQTFIAGIRGVTTGSNDAVPVMVDSNGQLGTVSSSRRFKEDIRDMDDASRDLLRLRPVTFRYKKPFSDGSKPIQYGLIAEEVADVYPDLVAHSADGQIETVKYQVLDVMLLNELQRQQAELGALEQQNRDLQQRLRTLEAALTERR